MNTTLMNSLINPSISQKFLRMDSIPDLKKDIVVRAGDIGYGFVKYCNGVDSDNNLILNSFPAIAVITPVDEINTSGSDDSSDGFSGGFGGSFFTKRDTKTIEVGGTHWEVGPEVNELTTSSDVRALHNNYVKSEQWKILFIGMLAYMDATEIDYLVLGLPVSDSSLASYVRAFAEGKHMVNGTEVNVKNVLIIPQPLGSLYNYAINSGKFESFLSTKTVVFDPGYYTFDFQTSSGFSVNANRSGSRAGGMSNILHAIKESIMQKFDSDFDDIEQIDSILKQSYDPQNDPERLVSIYGESTPLDPHIKSSARVIESSINYAVFNIGTFKDINTIILSGGPSRVFEKMVKDFFPKHNVLVMNGIFANVTGFMLWGIMTAIGTELQKEQSVKKKAS